MEKNYEHWSQEWEKTVSVILSNQYAAQAEIDECIKDCDLIGAATASFDHALTSWQLGDIKMAQVYIWVGAAFSQADLILRQEEIREAPLAVSFEVPKLSSVLDQFPGFEDEKELVEPLRDAALEAEALLALDPELVDSVEKNEVLYKAIAEACNLIFSDRVHEKYYRTNSKVQLLNLAKKMAQHLDINVDEKSMRIAFEAVENLMDAAIYVRGRTFSALNWTYRTFQEIRDGEVVSENTKARCAENTDTINKVRMTRTGIMASRHLLNLYEAHRPYIKGVTDFREPWLPQASSSQRHKARERYELSNEWRRLGHILSLDHRAV
jgi:hypothetical protein